MNTRTQSLEAALTIVERQYGKGIVIKGDCISITKVDTVSTGSLGIDCALGIEGLPFGRIVEIFGPESCGKTTLALQTITEAQKLGKTCVFIDKEHSLDFDYAKNLGVEIRDLLISQPDCGETALDVCETLINSGSVDVIVIDSVASLIPKAELEGAMGDDYSGLLSRLMSQALRKLTFAVQKNNVLLIFTNQIRSKIGALFGPKETTTGGNALKHYASIRIEMQTAGLSQSNNKTTGRDVRVKIAKNKLATPFKQANVKIMFGSGVSKTHEILELGLETQLITKAGPNFIYDNEIIGNGLEGTLSNLLTNPNIAEVIEFEIRNKLLSK